MIAYLHGQLADISPTAAIIDCTGVGYELNISLTTYSAIRDKTEVKLWVSEIIREDTYTLYGFATKLEQQLFGKLTTVSGVGPSTARIILSSFAPSELMTAISMGEAETLKSVKGIGLKTAQRIIVDLKGKIDLDTIPAESGKAVSANRTAVRFEASSALKLLGFGEAAIHKVIKQICESDPTIEVEDLIKQALRRL
ncbi:ATP-dependent DNA helicase RuvA [Porphyromonas crevioricanis]|uniref:Holliday junction branch migration protein RuvA n=1 Tax=Porphyromonas crevioricanis TaxID=393921 RepID=UPI00052D548C|nr:Holliday junction branch migration protein RuvA [Porphyromonas crevioricanis]KGN90818.1 ATP-dependent DNA helicase RuvA [Porphyromonas crevioricanis]